MRVESSFLRDAREGASAIEAGAVTQRYSLWEKSEDVENCQNVLECVDLIIASLLLGSGSQRQVCQLGPAPFYTIR